jgi:hypothetical protein
VSGKAGPTGTRLTDGIDMGLADQLDAVIQMAYMDGIYLQGDFARSCADVMACASSMGLITTENPDGSYGRVWRPTHVGYLWIKAGQSDV